MTLNEEVLAGARAFCMMKEGGWGHEGFWKRLCVEGTDLVGYLNCHHLSDFDRAVAEGARSKPKSWNPLLEVLWESGVVHEQTRRAKAAPATA